MLTKLISIEKIFIPPRSILVVTFSIFLLFLSAQFSIPWHPIPLTFQSSTVLFLAILLPRQEAIASVSGYILLGVFGVPVFANFSSGIQILFGATGGYILGFLFATIVCNFLQSKFRVNTFFAYLGLSFLGVFIIFFFGVSMLAHFVGLKLAYLFGVQPFLISEVIKTLILASVLSIKNGI